MFVLVSYWILSMKRPASFNLVDALLKLLTSMLEWYSVMWIFPLRYELFKWNLHSDEHLSHRGPWLIQLGWYRCAWARTQVRSQITTACKTSQWKKALTKFFCWDSGDKRFPVSIACCKRQSKGTAFHANEKKMSNGRRSNWPSIRMMNNTLQDRVECVKGRS